MTEAEEKAMQLRARINYLKYSITISEKNLLALNKSIDKELDNINKYNKEIDEKQTELALL